MTTEAQKRARLALTLGGLATLLQAGRPVARSEVFTQHRMKHRLEIEQSHKKQWQVNLLERLETAGILSRSELEGGRIAYQIADREKFMNMVEDCRAGGVILSSYLWPNEVAVPSALSLLESHEDDPETETESDSSDEKTAAAAHSLEEIFALLSQNVSFVRDTLIANGETIGAIYPKLDQVVSSGNHLEQKIGANNKRLEQFDQRLLDLHKLVEASHVIVKGYTSDAGLLREVLTALKDASATVSQSVGETKALRESVDLLLGQIKKNEADKLGKLLKALDSNTQEAAALKELIVAAMAEQ